MYSQHIKAEHNIASFEEKKDYQIQNFNTI